MASVFSLSDAFRTAEAVKGSRQQRQLRQAQMDALGAEQERAGNIASLSQAALGGQEGAFDQLAAVDPQRATQLRKFQQSGQPEPPPQVDVGELSKRAQTLHRITQRGMQLPEDDLEGRREFVKRSVGALGDGPLVRGIIEAAERGEVTNENFANFQRDTLGPLMEQVNAARTPEQTFDDERNLRQEFAKRTQEFQDVSRSFQRIQNSVENPSPAGDLALIFNYMKMLDPGSTVREGEFATAESAAGVPERLRQQYNKVASGEKLSPDQRQDFTNRAFRLYGGQLSQAQQDADFYRGLAQTYDLTPENVVQPFSSIVLLSDHPELGDVTTDEIGPLAKEMGLSVDQALMALRRSM